ncbi:MAG: hypothetical protein ACSLFM_13385 [Tepidiformaceae bacterium]
MRADMNDVAFRLLLSLSSLWEGLQRSEVEPSARGLHLTNEYLGGYTRVSAGPGSHARMVIEWNDSSRHLRVVRCEEWTGFDATISSTVAFVRQEARKRGLLDVVDAAFLEACREPAPVRRTIVTSNTLPARVPVARRA